VRPLCGAHHLQSFGSDARKGIANGVEPIGVGVLCPVSTITRSPDMTVGAMLSPLASITKSRFGEECNCSRTKLAGNVQLSRFMGVGVAAALANLALRYSDA
jgi:hypothetical protein